MEGKLGTNIMSYTQVLLNVVGLGLLRKGRERRRGQRGGGRKGQNERVPLNIYL